MRLLFVYSFYNIATPEKPIESPELIQFGISYISSYLKNHGHSTSLVVLSRLSGKKNEQIIEKYINDFRPQVIAFSSISTEYDFIRNVAKFIKRCFPNIYLLIGGFHVSLMPEGVLDDFDALCIGEGEEPTLELLEQLEKSKSPSGIFNLWIKRGKDIEKNPSRPFIQNLDILPFPDREMWLKWIKEGREARYSVLLGRGCPFECTYCCNHAFKKLASGIYTRYRSPGNIIDEINELIRKYPIGNEIYFEVETIGANKTWLIDLCDRLARLNMALKTPLHFGANLRITPSIDLRSIFQEFKKANFRFVNIGLESGSERIRREVLRRHYSNKDIFDAVRIAREYGLQVSFLNMVGLPGETLNDFKETIEMNRKCLPDWTGNSIFYPIPGTELYNQCQKQGLLKGHIDTAMERSRAILDLPGFSRRQIENSYIWFEYNVYRRHRPVLRLLVNVVRLKIKANPSLFLLYKRLRKIFSKCSGKSR